MVLVFEDRTPDNRERSTDHLYRKDVKKGAETAENAAGYTFSHTIDTFLNKTLLNNYEVLL